VSNVTERDPLRIAALLLSSLLASPAFASGGFISEVGMGYKVDRTTSIVLLPECETALVRAPSALDIDYRVSSCGGDNPAFVGWPIAYEWDVGEYYSVRAGWFHMSHWFDGGSDRETHVDMLAITVTIHWGGN
jgi:hypothetical protein